MGTRSFYLVGIRSDTGEELIDSAGGGGRCSLACPLNSEDLIVQQA